MDKPILTLGDKCIQTHPGKIPVIVYYNHMPNVTNNFLVDNATTINYLLVLVRRKNKNTHADFLCAFIDKILINNSELVSTLYSKHKNVTDGCLRITIVKENIFRKKPNKRT